MHLTAHDYHADRPAPTVGLTRVASLIARARDEARDMGALTLLLDNGDALQGTPMGDDARRAARRHPLPRAFTHLGYDAVGLGNHDMDFGLDQLENTLAGFTCPVVASNSRKLGGEVAAFRPHAVLDRKVLVDGRKHPLRIGILSFLPPQTARWSRHLLQGRIEIDDILNSARDMVPRMKALGCDLVIALAHSGLADGAETPGMENAVIPLAGIDGLDAVIAGHTHLTLPGPAHDGLAHVDARRGSISGKPVVMPGSAGSHLGIIDLAILTGADGRWRVADFDCSVQPIAARDTAGNARALVQDDPDLLRVLTLDHAETRLRMSRPVGASMQPLHSYFTFFAHDRALALVAAAQAAALRRLLPSLAPLAGLGSLPVLSAASPGKFGGRAGPSHYTDVPAGPLSMRHVADLHAFPNELRAVVLTGAEIAEWLEMSASLFRRIPAGTSGQALLDPAVPGHNFDVLFGVEYDIDLSVPPRFHPDGTRRRAETRRIRDLRHDGRPVTADDRFIVALNSYRASGGGNVQALNDASPLDLPQMLIRAALVDYLSGRVPAESMADDAAPWRFVPMPGTQATVRTGPGARMHLEELEPLAISPQGTDQDGFLQLALSLDRVMPRRLANPPQEDYVTLREVGAGERLANPVRSGRKQP